jgi:modulator of FtsH protease HflC
MDNKKTLYIAILLFAAFVLLKQSLFIVKEQEQVVITQFGKPVREAITEPGLYFKTPFTQVANYFEKRYMEWDGDPNQIPTKDKKFIYVDTYARWQITDPLQFFKRLTNERSAQSRLDDILDGETRNYIASHNIEEAVRNTNRQPDSTAAVGELVGDSLASITVGRVKIQNMILKSANEQAKQLGVEILDFRFKRINYVQEVREQVYKRMNSERFRIADKFRSEGQGEASKINGEKERELKTIQSIAFKEAEQIMGKADAEAAAIYSSAYNRSPQARNLYSFLKAMETLKSTSDSSTSVIISTKSELYKYLTKIN